MSVEENDRTLLIDLQCFPLVNYYKYLVEYNKLKFEQYEHYSRRSYRNRYYVAGPNGRILLSVPLLHSRRDRLAEKDLKICNRDRWQALHWKTLISAYRRSPWFEFYEEMLHPMYEKKFEYLQDWNLQAFELVNGWLDLSWEISFTEEYEKRYPPEANLKDARNRFLPQNTLDSSAESFSRYHQVFEDRTGFMPGLSILDLIFCEGKQAAMYLKESA